MRFRPTRGTHVRELPVDTVGGQNGARRHDRPILPAAPDAGGSISRAIPDLDRDGRPRAQRDEAPGGAAAAEAVESTPGGRLVGILAVTVVETLSIYAWLRLDDAGHPWWGLLALVAGESLETAVLQRFVGRGGLSRWGPLSWRDANSFHLRKMQRILGFAGNAETAIWVLWLLCAHKLGQEIAAVALLVAMHLKHQLEVAAARDVAYRTGLLSPTALVGSALEVAGAVACLALILDHRLVLAGVVLGAGLLLEHGLLINVLTWEITARDIRLPRDPRWRSPLRPLPELVSYATSHFAPFWRLVQRCTPLVRFGNHRAINALIGRIEPRPNPLSTMAPYTSWASLTDRTFSSRHLPPVPADKALSPVDGRPTSAAAASLFTRDQLAECPKTTVLFTFFAQWFTDGILRTERSVRLDADNKPILRNTRKNESNHDIDLAQLYGLNSAATVQLRGDDGLLKSQWINGEEYPPYYYVESPGGQLEPNGDFDKLPVPLSLKPPPPEQQKTIFAMGTDTSNIGFIAFNVLFLREHNRIARQLRDEHPSWDSDRAFETARNIVTVLLLKIVVEEYINHINPSYFKFRLLPGNFPNEPWFRPNWVAIEFNLLYRWHCLVPSTFHLGGKRLEIPEMVSNTGVLTNAGLGQLLAAASSQPAGRMGLFNTDKFLVQVAETPSIEQARVAGLASYNDYRRLCRHPPVTRFSEISSDPKIQQRLAELYPGGVEDVEFYVGLFAEDLGPNDVLPPLMMTMVAFDAFSQALTNPLLGPRVFNEETFSATGMDIIKNTSSISDIVQRNVPPQSEPHFVSLTRRGYKRV
jgi:prostaglandin-endoperoxide synthase 2